MKNKTPETKRGRRILSRTLIVLAVLATLVAVFYTEEDWRGKRAWENAKREIEAKGVVLDWNALIPPPVPADQNFFAAPKMQEWFVGRNRTDLLERMQKNTKTAFFGAREQITNEIQARDYLAWSDQFTSEFNLIQDALKRPYARMDGDYSQGYEIPIPNFIMVRVLAQTLGQRAHCYLLLNQPGKALDELTLLNDSRHLLLAAPTGQPMTLVSAMINVAVTGVYTGEIAEGLQRQAWNETQLLALQTQLQAVDLKRYVLDAFRCEQRATLQLFKRGFTPQLTQVTGPAGGGKTKSSFWRELKNPFYLLCKIIPHGWFYQNITFAAKMEQRQIEALEGEIISPRQCNALGKILENEFFDQASVRGFLSSPFTLVARIAVPNLARAAQTLAFNQTKANEAQIVCALERYHIAKGNYPETLDALVPQFIERIPPDLIGGQPLYYRRTDDGRFVLYSVGWNETDDGGSPGTLADVKNGDWVWQYPAR